MQRLRSADAPGARIVVVSPHLDDGVLSLGATMASWARRGARVELLTVFACDPGSDAETGGWDRRAGFRTEGEAARARREEDRLACALLGASPVWLPFGSVDFDRHGDEIAVREAVHEVVAGADMTLLPGFPLTHPDHVWLVRVLAEGRTPEGRLGLYAEQPYTRRSQADPRPPTWVEEALGATAAFARAPIGPRDRVAKWRAIRRYRSQLPLLAMARSVRSGAHAFALGPEAIAWVGDPAGRARD